MVGTNRSLPAAADNAGSEGRPGRCVSALAPSNSGLVGSLPLTRTAPSCSNRPAASLPPGQPQPPPPPHPQPPTHPPTHTNSTRRTHTHHPGPSPPSGTSSSSSCTTGATRTPPRWLDPPLHNAEPIRGQQGRSMQPDSLLPGVATCHPCPQPAPQSPPFRPCHHPCCCRRRHCWCRRRCASLPHTVRVQTCICPLYHRAALLLPACRFCARCGARHRPRRACCSARRRCPTGSPGRSARRAWTCRQGRLKPSLPFVVLGAMGRGLGKLVPCGGQLGSASTAWCHPW